jgi:hypothetical protein
MADFAHSRKWAEEYGPKSLHSDVKRASRGMLAGFRVNCRPRGEWSVSALKSPPRQLHGKCATCGCLEATIERDDLTFPIGKSRYRKLWKCFSRNQNFQNFSFSNFARKTATNTGRIERPNAASPRWKKRRGLSTRRSSQGTFSIDVAVPVLSSRKSFRSLFVSAKEVTIVMV